MSVSFEGGVFRWFVRALIGPILVERSDRPFVTGLWLVAAASTAGAWFVWSLGWLLASVGLGVLAALLFTLVGYWGQ